MKWLEDRRTREVVYFILFDIALFFFLYFFDQENSSGRAIELLLASFVSLFGMLLLFRWTNRHDALLIATAIFFIFILFHTEFDLKKR